MWRVVRVSVTMVIAVVLFCRVGMPMPMPVVVPTSVVMSGATENPSTYQVHEQAGDSYP